MKIQLHLKYEDTNIDIYQRMNFLHINRKRKSQNMIKLFILSNYGNN